MIVYNRTISLSVTCKLPAAPKDGFVSHFLGYELVGERIEYRCKTGYEMKGSDHNICLESGHWKYDSPICVERGKVSILCFYDSQIQPFHHFNMRSEVKVKICLMLHHILHIVPSMLCASLPQS